MQYIPRIIAKLSIGFVLIYFCTVGIENTFGRVLTCCAGGWFVVAGLVDGWKAIKGLPYDRSEDDGFVP